MRSRRCTCCAWWSDAAEANENLCLECGNIGVCRERCTYLSTDDGLRYCIQCEVRPGAPLYKNYYDTVLGLIIKPLDELQRRGPYHYFWHRDFFCRSVHQCFARGSLRDVLKAWRGVARQAQALGQGSAVSADTRRVVRETWTRQEWEYVVQQVAQEDWGTKHHGGYRHGEQRAVPDQAKVDNGSISSVVGEAKSAVGQDESSATGNEQREEGQVAHAASAVGEEHASEQEKLQSLRSVGALIPCHQSCPQSQRH